MTCHSDMDEALALKEIDYMNKFNHPNLIPCEVHSKTELYNSKVGAQSEVLIVMPFYGVGVCSQLHFSFLDSSYESLLPIHLTVKGKGWKSEGEKVKSVLSYHIVLNTNNYKHVFPALNAKYF